MASATTFHLYPELANELKAKIWEHALLAEVEGSRAVNVVHQQPRVIPFKSLCSPFLSVDSSSRREAKRFYDTQLPVIAFLVPSDSVDGKERLPPPQDPSSPDEYTVICDALRDMDEDKCQTRGVVHINLELDTFVTWSLYHVQMRMFDQWHYASRMPGLGNDAQRCLMSAPLRPEQRDLVRTMVDFIPMVQLGGIWPRSSGTSWATSEFRNIHKYLFVWVKTRPSALPTESWRGDGRLGDLEKSRMYRCFDVLHIGGIVGWWPAHHMIAHPPSLARVFHKRYRTDIDPEVARRHWSRLKWARPDDFAGYVEDVKDEDWAQDMMALMIRQPDSTSSD